MDYPAQSGERPAIMSRVTSKDGTSIAYTRAGGGPAVILIGGGLTDRSENAPLAELLAASFGVINYDRRGRGASGDTPPYAVARELEDLDALIGAAGGSAHVYGVSSGGALALEAAAAGLGIERLAVYEVPYDTAAGTPRRQREYVERLEALLGEGRRSDALGLFMRVAGSSEEGIAAARSDPVWPGLEAIAHTLAYDAACLGDRTPPAARLERIACPALVLTGDSGAFARAADAIAAFVPRAERRTLAGQGHMVDPAALGPVLARFFSD